MTWAEEGIGWGFWDTDHKPSMDASRIVVVEELNCLDIGWHSCSLGAISAVHLWLEAVPTKCFIKIRHHLEKITRVAGNNKYKAAHMGFLGFSKALTEASRWEKRQVAKSAWVGVTRDCWLLLASLQWSALGSIVVLHCYQELKWREKSQAWQMCKWPEADCCLGFTLACHCPG